MGIFSIFVVCYFVIFITNKDTGYLVTCTNVREDVPWSRLVYDTLWLEKRDLRLQCMMENMEGHVDSWNHST